MAGHSHWAGIKHKKDKADKKRSNMFSKRRRCSLEVDRVREKTFPLSIANLYTCVYNTLIEQEKVLARAREHKFLN